MTPSSEFWSYNYGELLSIGQYVIEHNCNYECISYFCDNVTKYLREWFKGRRICLSQGFSLLWKEGWYRAGHPEYLGEKMGRRRERKRLSELEGSLLFPLVFCWLPAYGWCLGIQSASVYPQLIFPGNCLPDTPRGMPDHGLLWGSD